MFMHWISYCCIYFGNKQQVDFSVGILQLFPLTDGGIMKNWREESTHNSILVRHLLYFRQPILRLLGGPYSIFRVVFTLRGDHYSIFLRFLLHFGVDLNSFRGGLLKTFLSRKIMRAYFPPIFTYFWKRGWGEIWGKEVPWLHFGAALLKLFW